MDSLKARVQSTWIDSCGETAQTPAEAEALVTEAISAAQASQGRTAVHCWQGRMAARRKEATRWLEGKQRRPGTGLSTAESLEHIQDFWQRFWNRPTVNRGDAVQRWRKHGRSHPCSFQPHLLWSAEALQKVAQTKTCSAPGVDCWRGDEIKYWAAYSELLCRWSARNSYPQAWQEVRQVQVPKVPAEELSGEVAAADLRPIVVMSILWRVAPSAVASSRQVQAGGGALVRPLWWGSPAAHSSRPRKDHGTPC